MLCIQKRLIEGLELDQPNSEKLVLTLEDNTLRDTTEEHAVLCETRDAFPKCTQNDRVSTS